MTRYVPQSDRYKTLQVIMAAATPLTPAEVRAEVIRLGGDGKYVSTYLSGYVRAKKMIRVDGMYKIK